ncbi:hypothetical protein PRNP1_003847 [Phytophthora ramorum]
MASTRVAYQEDAVGAKEAASQMLSAVHETKAIGYSSILDAVAAVKKEDVEFAVVAVETTSRGSCYETYDLLLKYDLAVVGEWTSDKGTRFWIVAKTPGEPSLKTTACKTSLVFAFASGNAHGQLHTALGFFASREIDLSKVESRSWSSAHPSAGKAEFIFYVDVKARQSDDKVVDAIAALRAMCSNTR